MMLKTGQRWSYRARSQDEASTVLIVAVDQINGHIVVNVSLHNLNAGPDAEPVSALAPVLMANVAGSLVALLDEECDVTSLEPLVADWRRQAEQGTAGFFTVGLERVAEIIAPSSV